MTYDTGRDPLNAALDELAREYRRFRRDRTRLWCLLEAIMTVLKAAGRETT